MPYFLQIVTMLFGPEFYLVRRVKPTGKSFEVAEYAVYQVLDRRINWFSIVRDLATVARN